MKDIKIQLRAGSDIMNQPSFFFRNMYYVLRDFNFIVTSTPDYVIYFDKRGSPSGNFIKVSYAREYMQTKMDECDYALGWQYPDQIKSNNYVRFPNYTFNGAGMNLIKPVDYNAEEIFKKKKKFCAFVYWHGVPIRNNFFERLNKYKHVDSPGPCLNNAAPINGHITPLESRLATNCYTEKVAYLRDYKFTIAMENRFAIGYTSEKIYNAMQADTIPIYYGNPWVHRDFNVKSFINGNAQDFRRDDHVFDYLMQRIVELDKDDDLYIKTLQQPWYPDNKCTPYTDPAVFSNFFTKVFHTR
jgi:hypothetical protein